jgi:hypothetical protein
MRRRRFEAAFIVTVGLGVAGAAGVNAQRTQNPPARRPPIALPHMRHGHVLTRDAEGVCRLRDLEECEPFPPGRCVPVDVEVHCPTALGVPGQIRVIADDVCEVTYTPNCRPDATCNPPRPRRIPCP